MSKKKTNIEVVKPKKRLTSDSVLSAPFTMMEYMVEADKELAAYRERELDLLTKILAELKLLNKARGTSPVQN